MLLCSWHVIRFNLHDVIIVLSCAALTVLSFSAVTRPRVLNVLNRKVRLNKACGTIADCTFEELCDRVSLSDCCLVKSAIRKTWFSHVHWEAAEPSSVPFFYAPSFQPVSLVAQLTNLWIWRGQNSSNTYRTTLLLNQSVLACDLRLGHRETHTFLDFLFILNPGCRWSSARNSHSASPGLYDRYDDIIVSLYWTSNFKTKLTSKFRITAYTAAVWTCLVCPRDFRFYLLNIQTCEQFWMYCDICTLLTWSGYTTCCLNISLYSKLHRQTSTWSL